MISSDIYTALSALVETGVLADVFDTKRDDGYVIPREQAIAVFQSISDVPTEIDISGPIIARENRWQVSIFALNLTAARSAKEAVIAALHGLETASSKRCDFDGCPGEIYESDLSPAEYHVPLEFVVAL